MKLNLIFELVELAISLAQTATDLGDVEKILLDIIQKSVKAYEDETGKTLDPLLIGAENAL